MLYYSCVLSHMYRHEYDMNKCMDFFFESKQMHGLRLIMCAMSVTIDSVTISVCAILVTIDSVQVLAKCFYPLAAVLISFVYSIRFKIFQLFLLVIF